MKQINFLVCSVFLFITHSVFPLNVVVTSNQDPTEIGKTTLRDAINQVNSSGDATNSISFNLGGADTIIFLDATAGLLPTIVNQVTMNGIDQASQQMVFIDGSNLAIEDGSENIKVRVLHFSDNGITSAAQSLITHIVIQNFIVHFSNDDAEISGIFFDGEAVDCRVFACIIQNFTIQGIGSMAAINSLVNIRSITYNCIENMKISDRGFLQGILVENESETVTLKGNCCFNRITDITSNLLSRAIDLAAIEGSCSYNTVSTVSAKINLDGIFINNLMGQCNNNIISDCIALEGNRCVGLRINMINNGFVLCNTIKNLKSMGGKQIGTSLSGIELALVENTFINNNSIENIRATNSFGQGILGGALVNSVISRNTITTIGTPNNTGYGINLLEDSTGNDILSNSIYEIDGKSINILDNGALTDARVILNSVHCFDGCKFRVEGLVIPSQVLNNAESFLLQFFASPTNNPSETKTLLGKYTHNTSQGTSFSATFSGLLPIETGQFITATATAFVEGSGENLNTSEVSNAVVSCAPFSNFCECPAVKPKPMPCPAVSCGEFIL